MKKKGNEKHSAFWMHISIISHCLSAVVFHCLSHYFCYILFLRSYFHRFSIRFICVLYFFNFVYIVLAILNFKLYFLMRFTYWNLKINSKCDAISILSNFFFFCSFVIHCKVHLFYFACIRSKKNLLIKSKSCLLYCTPEITRKCE